MTMSSGEPYSTASDQLQLVIDPDDLSGRIHLAGAAGPGWSFAPLRHLRVTDAAGAPVRWALVEVARGDRGAGSVEAMLTAGENLYRASIWLDGDEVLFELEPLEEPSKIGEIAFPGPLQPLAGPVTRLSLPRMRTNGVLYTAAESDHWVHRMNVSSHSGLNMPFWALGAEDQGLLAILDTPDDAALEVVKAVRQSIAVEVSWRGSLGTLRSSRRIRVRPLAEDSYVAAALAYRAHVQRQGRFKSLAEKIEERPTVRQLIGGPYLSVGYLPYSERKFRQVLAGLREIGYTNGIIGPIDHVQWASGEWLNDYQPFIHAPHYAEIAREAGFAAFAWLYLEDILRWDPYFDPAWLVRREDGEPVEGWFNRDYEYFLICSKVLREQHRQLKDRITRFDALHFDTTTAKDLFECRDPDHPMSRTVDRESRRARLAEVASWNMLLGSEAGYDWAFDVYDFCSSNPRMDLETGMPVPVAHIPLLGLVYHDAIVSYCWEYDPYNKSYLGGDWSRQKILYDVMAGNPPTVAPIFGYFPVIRRPPPPVESRWVMWEDPETQRLLREALPVAQLHGRTAHVAMIDHELLAGDGLVTRTVYADGTEVLVNRGTDAWDDGQAVIGAMDYRVT